MLSKKLEIGKDAKVNLCLLFSVIVEIIMFRITNILLDSPNKNDLLVFCTHNFIGVKKIRFIYNQQFHYIKI